MEKKKILAIDDELSVLTLLEKRLSTAGYHVLVTTDAKEGLQIAKQELPDLIILDILMPGMDGSETAARLRSDAKTEDIPIMFLTCLFTKFEELSEGHEIGKNFFIAKPYEPQALLEEISKIIGK